MPQRKGAKRSSPPAKASQPRPSPSIENAKPGPSSIPPASWWAKTVLPPLVIILAPVLAFIFSSAVRDWLLGALGYGLIPVALWLVLFGLALRFRYVWIRSFWRPWLGSAMLVAISLGIVSMFDAAGGVPEDASLGGYWGEYLGGRPLALGILKVAVLVFLTPLLLYPRRGTAVYKREADRTIHTGTVASRWLGPRLLRGAKAMAEWRPGTPQQTPTRPPTSIPTTGEFPEPLPEPPGPPEPMEVVEAAEGTPESLPESSKVTQGWQLPSLDLLSISENRPMSPEVLLEMAQHIEQTLAEHKVDVAVEDIRTGPRVIRFGLVPGWSKKYRESMGTKAKTDEIPGGEMSRVKVQSILVREKDLALALKTPYLRLEAPVPGEALVGLEVPNPFPNTVVLKSVAESPIFQKISAKGGLPVALGQDTAGDPIVAELTGLPHLLIAGATGSGKSVCINSVITSLLLTCQPDSVRMLMIDPKRVELTPFKGIPHLVAPVITDTDEVLAALRAVQNEMLRRYKLMEEVGTRNIEAYNKKASEPVPFLVIIVDELADLMMAAAYEVEQSLVRLAQLGRATGIHLILATQRPSVNVVTGLLKANIPARIAFAVASQVDSRVILDSVGAEKLLGKGDMLMLSSDTPQPKRVQGTFVHDREIENLVEFWRAQSGPPIPKISLDDTGYADVDQATSDEDDLLDKARELAQRFQHLSPSILQRRLQIGYLRAKELLEQLEEEGSLSGPRDQE